MAVDAYAVVDADGIVVDASVGYARLLHTTLKRLVGAKALHFTAPADRERSVEVLRQLSDDHRTVATIQRVIRADGTHLWVTSTVSYVPDTGDGRAGFRIVSEPANLPDDWVEPNKLLRIAKFLDDSRRARTATFDPRLFVDPAWDLLLSAYICEAEGDLSTLVKLSKRIGLRRESGLRWLRALVTEGLVMCEPGDGTDLATCPFNLTAAAHERMERYLAGLYSTLTPADRMNMPA